MKNQSELKTLKLYIYIILLAIWGMISVFLFVNYTAQLSILGIVLDIFIIILSLTRLFKYSSWVSLFISALLYIGTGYSILNNNQEFLVSSGIGLGIFLITTVICQLYANQVQKTADSYSRLQQVIDSLIIYDQNTSLMRWKFARQTLNTEILRGRRYQNDVTLVFFDVRNKEQFPENDIRRIQQTAAEIIQSSIRTDIDIGFIGDVIGLILPETGLSGAQVLTERLIKRFSRKVDAYIAAGICSFPEDAISPESMIEKAEDALRVALNSEQSMVSSRSMDEKPIISERKGEDEFTQPIDLGDELDSHQDYVAILENIDLSENEWVVWIEGFDQMSDLIEIEKSLRSSDHVENVEFLFLQANHLVVKIQSAILNLADEAQPFPGWQVKKTNLANHYFLIAAKEEPDTTNDA
jgi:GGDEF domain-containing protein